MENNFSIDNFIQVRTVFANTKVKHRTFVTSTTGSVHDFFESHLADSLDKDLKKSGIDIFKIKIGDVLTLQPTKWVIAFSKKENLDLSDDYNKKYKITDISVDYNPKDATPDGNFQKIFITLYINPI